MRHRGLRSSWGGSVCCRRWPELPADSFSFDKTLSRSCPTQKRKNFVSRARSRCAALRGSFRLGPDKGAGPVTGAAWCAVMSAWRLCSRFLGAATGGFRPSSPAVDAAVGESGTRSRNGFQRSMAAPRAQLPRVSATPATSPCGSIIRIGLRIFGWNAWDEVKLVFRLGTRSSLPRRGPSYVSGRLSSRCHRSGIAAWIGCAGACRRVF